MTQAHQRQQILTNYTTTYIIILRSESWRQRIPDILVTQTFGGLYSL